MGSDKNEIQTIEFFEEDLMKTNVRLSKAGEAVKVPPDFQARLQTKLYTASKDSAARPKQTRTNRSRYIGLAAAGLALIAVVFAFLLPALKPDKQIAQPPENPTEVAEQPTDTVEAVAPTDQSPIERLLIAFFGSTVQAQTGGSDIFGASELTVTAAFPESPAEAVVYEQAVEEVTSPEQQKPSPANWVLTVKSI